MSSYLLRVQLEDRPGSLGSLAVALGSVGADILSLDVVERGSDAQMQWAVDDIVVDLPAGSMPDALITAAEAIRGVRVDTIRPHTGLLEAHRELELLDLVAAAHGRDDKLQTLVDTAPRVLRVGWCSVVRQHDDGLERLVGGTGAPETQVESAPWLPITHATVLHTEEGWVPQLWRDMDTALAAAPLGDPHTAMVLGRPGGPEFRPSEVARLGYLAGIVASLIR